MTFLEKSSWLMVAILVLVWGAYGAHLFGAQPADGAWRLDDVRGPLIGVVVATIVLAIVGHILITIQATVTGDAASDKLDERDRAIHARGRAWSGDILAVGVIVTIIASLMGLALFWVVHALIGLVVLTDFAKWAIVITGYRRGG